MPKSQLQCYGELVYCVGDDLLNKCNIGESPIERFKAVLAWNFSTLRPLIFGVVPYNPILGETHHVSKGTLNVLVEQVSHHPSVAALYATDEKENIQVLWCQYPVAKFSGLAAIKGNQLQRNIHDPPPAQSLNDKDRVLHNLFPPGVGWGGTYQVRCLETGLEAELTIGGRSFVGLRGTPKSIIGKIFHSSSKNKPLFDINGHWDRSQPWHGSQCGEMKQVVALLVQQVLVPAFLVQQLGVWQSESGVVWREVSQCIMEKNWAKAGEAKKDIEENQRMLMKERKSKSETWVPKYFSVSYSKENGWDCSPLQKTIPPAPIVVPLNN
ncbi:hypothetical protein F8388_010816 [Cannabis sativa]|uniref:Oxysterol-binding protein n=1 Tax=Cannabis sativa TaxID=3483 RepID=A0A7J6HBU4_CANSA|nr:hypothetical protein F8388_010816 [Cannabis sativa]